MVNMGTKGQTLQRLRPKLTDGTILPVELIDHAQWVADPKKCLSGLRNIFKSQKLIVRSSAQGEDSEDSSMAGCFLSLKDLSCDNAATLESAINEVFESYNSNLTDEHVLVQPQLEHLAMAGVLFTHEMETLAPYYVFSVAGDTDTVTSGGSRSHRTFVRYRNASTGYDFPWQEELLTLVTTIETLVESQYLDIEFAVMLDGSIRILQVRPIVREQLSRDGHPSNFGDSLSKIHRKIERLNLPHPDIVGSKTIFGVMPDWNPAEIVGRRPRALALSLYKELVTDSIWAYQRHNYGYRNMRSFPLLINFMGLPYIDVRVSFNSFVPEELDVRIAHKLVDYYLGQLESSPSDHDKVEFNIVFTCSYPGLSKRLKVLKEHGFSDNEIDRIKYALLGVTNQVPGHLKDDLAKVKKLEERHKNIMQSDMSVFQKIYWLMEDCKRYGTLPFAGLARGGFVAGQFLDGLVDIGLLSPEDKMDFMGGLNTVSGQIVEDVSKWRAGALDKEDFLADYGHLRPGTYDILSPRYDEAFDSYFHAEIPRNEDEESHRDVFAGRYDELGEILVEHGIRMSPQEFTSFLREAIEAREFGKFMFTRHLSDILVLVRELGERFEFDADAMSFVNIKTILELYANLEHRDVADILEEDIVSNRAQYEMNQFLKLPRMITQPDDIYSYQEFGTVPNFITQVKLEAQTISSLALQDEDLIGKIVFIENADPGYDWLFTRNIGGLVTEYGGVNSHMAIRAAELKIPAVIGCGKKLFDEWRTAQRLELDCANQLVRRVA